MQCYRPIFIENKKTGDYIQVDCQRCNFCLANFRDDWAFRMTEQQKISHTSHFITLTYDQQYVPRVWDKNDKMYLTLRKEDLYRFLKQMKRDQDRHLKKHKDEWRIKYFAVGEYGSEEFTTRPHYHLITFNTHPETITRIQNGAVWGKGIVDASVVETGGAPTYCTKYLIDRKPFDEEDPREPVFRTMSRGQGKGIGYSYLEKNRDWHRAEDEYYPDNFRMYRVENGYMKRLPRYYKKKLKTAHREDRQEVLDQAFEIYYEEMKAKIDAKYKDDIEQLAKVHPNPQLYYLECLKNKHEQIRIKSLKLNKL